MVTLNIEKINLLSPYAVKPASNRSWMFVTDFGNRYGVTFDTDNILKSSEAYQFTLTNLDGKPSPRDPKLRDTIVAIIREFFDSNQSTMLYICETGDGRQDMRNRLFAHWFRAFADEGEYYYRHMEVQEEDVTNYITMILRRDNPDAALVLEEWESTEIAFNAKPVQEP